VSDLVSQLQQLVPLVERQHALIEALRVRSPRPVSSCELAKDLGVSPRTVERDIGRLKAAGVPLAAQKGPGGGYRIEAPRRPRPIDLTAGEIAILITSVAILGPYSSATGQSAMAKLLAALDGGS
jgi:predicted DNA-binding transcriptional regulator YafY